MKLFAKRMSLGLPFLVGLCILLTLTNLTSRRRVHAISPIGLFCDHIESTADAPPYHMVFFLDLKSCLSCNEDMDAWRQLCTALRERGGAISVYSRRSDSADVAWAMHLEGISDTTHVLDDTLVDVLDWRRLGTPVKLLLDSECRQVKIGGFMGNRAESQAFINQVEKAVCVLDQNLASH
jgi:hypothetical protein